jgi:hypothetical protein
MVVMKEKNMDNTGKYDSLLIPLNSTDETRLALRFRFRHVVDAGAAYLQYHFASSVIRSQSGVTRF